MAEIDKEWLEENKKIAKQIEIDKIKEEKRLQKIKDTEIENERIKEKKRQERELIRLENERKRQDKIDKAKLKELKQESSKKRYVPGLIAIVVATIIFHLLVVKSTDASTIEILKGKFNYLTVQFFIFTQSTQLKYIFSSWVLNHFVLTIFYMCLNNSFSNFFKKKNTHIPKPKKEVDDTKVLIFTGLHGIIFLLFIIGFIQNI